MTAELLGVPLYIFRDPIQQALKTYETKTEDELEFDTIQASNLVLTPDKPNSARSVTEAKYKGNNIGTLYVIAFKPQDGTGDEKTYLLKDLTITPPYPPLARIVPRSKIGVHNEGHLTVVTQKIEDAHAEPKLFDGTFDLLGLHEQKVLKIGILGQSESNLRSPEPRATYTTGYNNESKRFGDPHAVFSSLPDRIQVCAFLAISEAINTAYANILKSLNPQFPFYTK